jgi:hypothetical protein
VVSATALTPSDLAAERIRETTAQVLAGPDFADARPGVLDQAARWALDRVGELLAAIIAGGGGPLGLALLAVALVALGLIVASLVRRVRRDRGRPVPRPDGIGGRSAADWVAEAERAEAAGAWAAALRCRYRALLADLVAAGVLDEVPGRTARGYQRDVASAAPAATRPMREVTRAFEAAWYDRRPVDAADVAALRDAADAVRRRVPVAA